MNRREFLKKSLEGIVLGVPLISSYNLSKITPAVATTLDNDLEAVIKSNKSDKSK